MKKPHITWGFFYNNTNTGTSMLDFNEFKNVYMTLRANELAAAVRDPNPDPSRIAFHETAMRSLQACDAAEDAWYVALQSGATEGVVCALKQAHMCSHLRARRAVEDREQVYMTRVTRRALEARFPG